MAPEHGQKTKAWLSRHQRTLREWLVLVAAVIAGVAGWQQIADERDARKDAEDDALLTERRAQANEIAAWIGPRSPRSDDTSVVLSNHSHQPVYQAVVSRVTIQASGAYTGRQIPESLTYQEQKTLSIIPPGRSRIYFGPGFGGMSKSPGIEIAFRDQAGHNWVRYASGVLNEIHLSPTHFYGLAIPVHWQPPEQSG